jgi:phage baseplate assembly protein W
MAVDVKYYPEDVGRGYGSLGIKLPMNNQTKNSYGGLFEVSYTTEEQAISNYINLLLTKPGERYMQPTFGVGLQLKLFEQIDDALLSDIELEIQQQSQYWLPYIVNHSIDVIEATKDSGVGVEYRNSIIVVIKFSVTENGANRTMRIFNVDGITRVEVE